MRVNPMGLDRVSDDETIGKPDGFLAYESAVQQVLRLPWSGSKRI